MVRLFSLLLALSLFAWNIFPLELLVHFRLHFLLLAPFFLAYLLRRKNYRESLVLALLCVALFARLSAYLPPVAQGKIQGQSRGGSLKMFVGNINFQNEKLPELFQVLQALDVDILSLSEVTPELSSKLSFLSLKYPYLASFPPDLHAGQLLFSKHPLLDSKYEVETLHLEARVKLSETKILSLISASSPPPLSPAKLKERNYFIETLGSWLAKENGSAVLLGDLNATPWSKAVLELIERAQLKDLRKNRGYLSSWPSVLPAFLGIPIDHCLVSKDLKDTSLETVYLPGSDHLGIFCEVEL